MMGLFLENGPFVVRDDGSVAERNASWNNRYDMLWVDQPAGTGFSVATLPDGYAKSQDAVAAAFVEFMGNLYATYRRRVETLPVGPGVAMSFKRTTLAVQRCKNQPKRCSYGRDRTAARRYPNLKKKKLWLTGESYAGKHFRRADCLR